MHLRLLAGLVATWLLLGCLEPGKNLEPTEESERPVPADAPITPSSLSVTPLGPKNFNDPVIHGTTSKKARVILYPNSQCSGSSIAMGTADESGIFNISVHVADNTTTTVYAKSRSPSGFFSGCSTSFITYVENSLELIPPSKLSVEPSIPSNDNAPHILGVAQEATTVTLYSDASCSTIVASGPVDTEGKFDIQTSVADNSFSIFYAKSSGPAGLYLYAQANL